MCGIAAIFAYAAHASNVDEHELVAIRDHMLNRGPDGAGIWLESHHRAALGHRRLSIIDLTPAAAQPMELRERQLVVAFNGEIYNYRELRAALERKGRIFKSTSDTEVLLHLYAEHGEAMVDQLRGMYAFALWDGEKRGLFLARDPFGIKPLYLADDGRTLRAASQVKALVAGGRVSRGLSPAGQVGFHLWGHVPEPFTIYREVRSLAAGSTLWVDANGMRRSTTFCSINQVLACPETTTSGAPRDLASALRDSVAHHLVADVPVGVFLSSGLDSTTLAALATEQGVALRTVTLGFEEFRGTPDDETPLAELVARRLGAHHQTVWITRRNFKEYSPRLLAAMDQPTTDGVNTYFVSLAARQAGLKVALSGLGGDELFGGYPSFHQLPSTVRWLGWLGAPNPMGRWVRVVSAPLIQRFTSPKYAGLFEYGGSYAGAYILRRGMFMPWELPEFLDPDLVRKGWEELQPLARLSETVAHLVSPRKRVCALEMCWYMRSQLLRDADWAGMAHSLEIRVPLVDLHLLRAVSSTLNGSQAPRKCDLANAPRISLPAEILHRPKTGFRIPVRDWLRDVIPCTNERGLRGWARHVYSRYLQN